MLAPFASSIPRRLFGPSEASAAKTLDNQPPLRHTLLNVRRVAKAYETEFVSSAASLLRRSERDSPDSSWHSSPCAQGQHLASHFRLERGFMKRYPLVVALLFGLGLSAQPARHVTSPKE